MGKSVQLQLVGLALFLGMTVGVSVGWAERAQFTDQNLQQVLNQSAKARTSGVLYTWSPRMNLSSVGSLEIQKIAEDLRLEVTILLDPLVSEKEVGVSAQDAVTRNAATLRSNTLSNLGIFLHYPSLILYKNGKIVGPVRPGYDEPGRLRQYILKTLGRAP